LQGVGGLHIIVSPLNALAEEQVQQIKERGLFALRIGTEMWEKHAEEITG